VFLLRADAARMADWEALVPAWPQDAGGERLAFRMGSRVRYRAGEFGSARCGFQGDVDLFQESRRSGTCRCRRYKRADEPADRERYQTVYAREKGSVAAPTAGCISRRRCWRLPRARGEWPTSPCTWGSAPFSRCTPRVEDGRLHAERYQITGRQCGKMRAARRVVRGDHSVRTSRARGMGGG